MKEVTQADLTTAYKEVCSIISKCEKVHVKFNEGTSQHTLLLNRINAMGISKLLVENEFVKLNASSTSNIQKFVYRDIYDSYSKTELEDALKPIRSIISKCEKAQKKHEVNTKNFNRYINLIQSMAICEILIENNL